jgi:oligoendopeptidase F
MANKINAPIWNLIDLYESIDSDHINQDFISLTKEIEGFSIAYRNQIKSLKADDLYHAIVKYEKIEERLGKLSSYAQLVYAAKTDDEIVTNFYQNTIEKCINLSTSLLFFALEINKLEDQYLETLIVASTKLQHFQPWLRDIRALKDYELSLEIEELLHTKYITSKQSWVRLYDESQADLLFHMDGKDFSINEIFQFLTNPNEEIRAKAAKVIGTILGQNIKLFTLITNVLAKDKQIEDKLRGFAQPISSRNLDNLVEDEVVECLIQTVKANYKSLSHRYYQIKAKLLNKDKLEYWDRNAPIAAQEEKLISWEEGKEIVLDAYHRFSPEMADIALKFFEKKWIDAEVRKGKDSGAFSHSSIPSCHPYILMNYQGKLRDVMTLAHELGHGVHQYLAREQGALMADTPLTLAETASVFGEQLTFRALLGKVEAPQKKIILANKVEDMLNTVVRQIAFCEFEKKIHAIRNSRELPAEEICEIWLEVQKESLGPVFNFSEEYKYYWSYISHFIHSPFYVYAYAFGDCLVNSLYRVYLEDTADFVPKYIEMLKAGGTKRHKELLKPFGLDASKSDFWQKGLDFISSLIDEIDDGNL